MCCGASFAARSSRPTGWACTTRAGPLLACSSALVTRVVELYGDHYTDLRTHRDTIVEILTAEEVRFLATLKSGTDKLNDVLKNLQPGAVVEGDVAFQLHDTYGFPYELTTELAEERGMSVDRAHFDELMQAQRERARAAAGGGSLPTEQAAAFVRTARASEFVGFDDLEIETSVTAFERVTGDDSSRVLIKLDQSPFYAEGGGQVSDTGVIIGEAGRATIEHVMRFETDQVIVVSLDGDLSVGDRVSASVDAADRLATESNHTATHLLHRALRDNLGDHVRQAGSLVEPGRLRFDFVHTHALSGDELARVEHEVNGFIAAGLPVDWNEYNIDEAREQGAMMLFGEKYGERVRLVDVGNGESRELCGGTHVSNTNQINTFLVTGESSVGANTRRIEAITGQGAIDWLTRRARVAEAAAAAANVDIDRLVDHIGTLTETSRKLERELSQQRSGSAVDDAVASARQAGGINVVAFRADGLSGDELLDLSDRLKNKLAPAAVLVGSVVDGKVQLVAGMSDEAIAAGVKAGDVVGAAAKVAGGGGGGRPNMARAGGKDPSKIDEALKVGLEHMLDAAGATV